jgi:hypothetical protein
MEIDLVEGAEDPAHGSVSSAGQHAIWLSVSLILLEAGLGSSLGQIKDLVFGSQMGFERFSEGGTLLSATP